MNHIKTDHENYVRDMGSNAVLNTDVTSYNAYKKQRDIMLKSMTEIDTLKNEIIEIKSMLISVMTSINKNNNLGQADG